MSQVLTGELFLQMLQNGANNLTNKHEEINALNVFPVPDGDTGTNMNLTFTSGVSDAKGKMNSNLGMVSKTLSRGLLMGARGNSGVILSQIFRGIANEFDGIDEADVLKVSKAFVSGREVAYKAVMRPVEGTILTVLRESAEKAHEYVLNHKDITLEEYFEVLVQEAITSLNNTPNLLPVLKEVGVVDSGGKGYLTILEGFLETLKGNTIELNLENEDGTKAASTLESDEYGYCTEFIIRLEDSSDKKDYDENYFRKELEAIGNSLVVVTDEDLVKVHVHTLNPGNALNLGQQYGEFIKLKIENMTEQHNTILNEDHGSTEPKEKEKYALVSVAAGDGIEDMFKELRVNHIISGGQTMNPSTEDFVEAIDKIDAENIFIFPNNSNIIMAANQVKDVIEDKNIVVIETKTIPQGLAACIMFNPEVDVEENVVEMNQAVENTSTGQVTYAIKDTTIDNLEIKAKDYMGILEKDIVVSTPNRIETTKELIKKLINPDSEIVTLISGEDTNEEEVNELVSFIEDTYDVEVESYQGNQPVYSYIIGVE